MTWAAKPNAETGLAMSSPLPVNPFASQELGVWGALPRPACSWE